MSARWVLCLDNQHPHRVYVVDVRAEQVWWPQARRHVWIVWPILGAALDKALRFSQAQALERVYFLRYGQPPDLIRAQPYAVRRVLQDASGEWTR